MKISKDRYHNENQYQKRSIKSIHLIKILSLIQFAKYPFTNWPRDVTRSMREARAGAGIPADMWRQQGVIVLKIENHPISWVRADSKTWNKFTLSNTEKENSNFRGQADVWSLWSMETGKRSKGYWKNKNGGDQCVWYWYINFYYFVVKM